MSLNYHKNKKKLVDNILFIVFKNLGAIGSVIISNYFIIAVYCTYVCLSYLLIHIYIVQVITISFTIK